MFLAYFPGRLQRPGDTTYHCSKADPEKGVKFPLISTEPIAIDRAD